MSIALLVIEDGRDEYAAQALESAIRYLPKFDQYIFVNDRDHALGYGGAIAEGWSHVRTDYVFHFEADFVFHGPVPVEKMRCLLKYHPELVQVALKRQPVNPQEIAAGGVMEQYPDDYTDRYDHWLFQSYVEHRHNFTTNPCIYRGSLCDRGWPQVPQSEGIFSIDLLQDPDISFAYLGAKSDPPLCEHIGLVRSGGGY